MVLHEERAPRGAAGDVDIADTELADQIERLAVGRFLSVCLKDVKASARVTISRSSEVFPIPGFPSTLRTAGCPLRAASSAAAIALIWSSCQSTLVSPPLPRRVLRS